MKLKEYIEVNGIRKAWFAEKLGITASTLSLILTEKQKPRKSLQKLICIYTKEAVTEKDFDWGK